MRLLKILPSVLVACCISSPASAVFVPTIYHVPQVGRAPDVDGRLDEAVWSRAEVITPFFAYQSGGAPPAAITTARVLWDSTHIYLGMEMQDADIRSSCSLSGACARDSALFQGDVIEFFVRERTDSPRYHEFEWSPRNDQFDARFDNVRFGSPGTAWQSGVVSAVQVDGTVDDGSDVDTGWTIEASIPIDDFLLAIPDAGVQWRFTFARYDFFNVPGRSNPALMMSTPGDPTAPNGGVTSGFHTYEIYDTLEFVGVPEPATALLAGILAAGLLVGRRRFRTVPQA